MKKIIKKIGPITKGIEYAKTKALGPITNSIEYEGNRKKNMH